MKFVLLEFNLINLSIYLRNLNLGKLEMIYFKLIVEVTATANPLASKTETCDVP